MHPSTAERPRAADLTGHWQRTLLRIPGRLDDTTSEVDWLQVGALYVDLRPDQGFAGVLRDDDDAVVWDRLVDLSPTTGAVDAGLVHWTGDVLVEQGRDEDYVEHWERRPDAGGPVAGAVLRGDDGTTAVVVRVGGHVGWAADAPAPEVSIATSDGVVVRSSDASRVGRPLDLGAADWRVERLEGRADDLPVLR